MKKSSRPTIAKCLATVARQCRNSKLTDKTWESISHETAYLKRRLHLSPMQCYFLAAMMRKPCESVSTSGLAEFANVSPVEVLAYQSDIDNLVERGFVALYKDYNSMEWRQFLAITEATVRAIRMNKELEKNQYDHVGVDEFWKRIETYLDECEHDNISYSYMLTSIRSLITGCTHLRISKEALPLKLKDPELLLLLIACSKLVNEKESTVYSFDYNDIIPTSLYKEMTEQFKNNTSPLQKKDMLHALDDDCDTFALTNHAREILLGKGYVIDTTPTEEEEEPQEPKEKEKKPVISEKKMFYNKEEKEQVDRLTDILSQERFAEVQSRMQEANMRIGFCCIFHGAPGTGKTETVLQIARKTGREVVQVNIASIRSMWVGESEQNIKSVFDDYKKKVGESDNTPILFFNEADAVFAKRMSGANTEVDEMSNRIQNIILQEMETFEGILIATTNLTENFDTAFERRFLYKVEFKKPQLMTRKAIWLSMIPHLNGKDALTLASKYDFTGGNIENIARKVLVDKVLYGRLPSLDDILVLCDEEKLHKTISFKKLSA